MLTDSHCHLASQRYEATEIPDLIRHARAAGVSRMVTLSTSLDDLHANISIADHPGVHACIGIHPCDVHHAPADAMEQLARHAADPRVCGVGETGLDYYHPAPDGWNASDMRMLQRAFLKRHFELASKSGLNVVIHTRDLQGYASFEDALDVYREFHHRTRAVFHCFTGPWENAKRILDLGGILSFGGAATFKSAHAIRETIQKCPEGSFMLETDAPYLAPEPHRGKRNEPAYMKNTATFLAGLRGESIEQLSQHTEWTTAAFFRFRSTSK
jgi:TatD DNase family protein